MAFDLDRFVSAHSTVYEGALDELRAGRKTGHWIWFVFPQIAGLGTSANSRFYAIESLDEARAYLADPILAPRLRECAHAMLGFQDRRANDILGPIDAAQVRSSMTLFHRADPDDPVFSAMLTQFYDGAEDPATIERLT